MLNYTGYLFIQSPEDTDGEHIATKKTQLIYYDTRRNKQIILIYYNNDVKYSAFIHPKNIDNQEKWSGYFVCTKNGSLIDKGFCGNFVINIDNVENKLYIKYGLWWEQTVTYLIEGMFDLEVTEKKEENNVRR
jgi:hypothetical protein